MVKASTSIRVRYQETDKMGVVYHGNFFTWMEVARIHLLDSIGCPYRKLEEDGYLLPVISCECDFKSPARFDDIVDVDVLLAEIKKVRIKLEYTIRRGETVLATAKTSHAFVDLCGKAVRPPEQFLEKSRLGLSHSV